MTDPPWDRWWAEYFDGEFVELYRPFLSSERTQEEVGAIVELLDLAPGTRVLDLACGWGRHAIELARSGCAVTGIDLSPTLLDRARRRAAATGVRVEWVRGDMRELPWENAFDAVICVFSSLGYFLDDVEDERVLRGVGRALRPDGLFLMETMHRDGVARGFVERDWWPGEHGGPIWVEREFDALTGISSETVRWRTPDGRDVEKTHALQVRTATDWQQMLKRCGFEPLAWYGDWALEPFEYDAERLIVVSQRG